MDIGVLLFTDFELLDACGPIEIVGRMKEVRFTAYSPQGGTVLCAQKLPFVTAPLEELSKTDVLLVPGGRGTRALVQDQQFLSELVRAAAKSKYILSVCTGSALLGAAGLLDGRRATSNKKAFSWAASTSSKTQWQPSARWVTDGIYYTSSGVSAGMDMALGFVADQFGREEALRAAEEIEYIWNENPEEDPFAVCNKAVIKD